MPTAPNPDGLAHGPEPAPRAAGEADTPETDDYGHSRILAEIGRIDTLSGAEGISRDQVVVILEGHMGPRYLRTLTQHGYRVSGVTPTHPPRVYLSRA